MIDEKINFKEFRLYGQRVGSDYIGITAGGAITFYSGFYQANELSKYEYCIILFSKEKMILGLQFGGKELGKGSFKIKHSDERKTGYISGGGFFKTNEELNLSQLKGRYSPKKYEDDSRKNVFIIDLNKKVK